MRKSTQALWPTVVLGRGIGKKTSGRLSREQRTLHEMGKEKRDEM